MSAVIRENKKWRLLEIRDGTYVVRPILGGRDKTLHIGSVEEETQLLEIIAHRLRERHDNHCALMHVTDALVALNAQQGAKKVNYSEEEVHALSEDRYPEDRY